MATIKFTPTILTIPENPKAGDRIARLDIEGEIGDGEVFSFKLEDSLNDRFEIFGNGLRVKTGGSLFDYEIAALSTFALRITATGDQETEVAPAEITVMVTDVN